MELKIINKNEYAVKKNPCIFIFGVRGYGGTLGKMSVMHWRGKGMHVFVYNHDEYRLNRWQKSYEENVQ